MFESVVASHVVPESTSFAAIGCIAVLLPTPGETMALESCGRQTRNSHTQPGEKIQKAVGKEGNSMHRDDAPLLETQSESRGRS